MNSLLFTDNDDTNREIICRVDDRDILAISVLCKYSGGLLNAQFWRMRFIRTHGIDLDEYGKIDYLISYKECKNKDVILRLYWAAERGYLSMIKHTIEILQPVFENHNNQSIYDNVFVYGAMNSHFNIVDYFLERGIDIHCSNDYVYRGVSKNGDLLMLEYLISKKKKAVDIDQCLYESVKKGYLDVARYLVKQGAKNERIGYLSTKAVKKGNLELFKFIVDISPVDINRLAYHAVEFGRLNILKFLKEEYINIFNYNINNLRIAAQCGHFDVLKYLMYHGRDIYCQNDLDEALISAVEHGHLNIVKYLIKKGVDVNIIDKYNIGNILVLSINRGYLKITKYLISKGADIHNNLVLKEAVKNNRIDIVKILLKSGVDTTVVKYPTDIIKKLFNKYKQ